MKIIVSKLTVQLHDGLNSLFFNNAEVLAATLSYGKEFDQYNGHGKVSCTVQFLPTSRDRRLDNFPKKTKPITLKGSAAWVTGEERVRVLTISLNEWGSICHSRKI